MKGRYPMMPITGNMEMLKSDAFRKSGATKADIKMIADLYAKGRTVEQISVALNVQEAVVKAFLPVEVEAPTEMEIAAPPAPVEAEPVSTGFFKKAKQKHKR